MEQSHAAHYSMQSWPTARQFQRAKLEVPVAIETGGECFRGWSLNISEGGFAITVAAQLRNGQEIAACFDLTADRTIRVKAVVRHGDGFRYGFEMLAISPEDRQAVRAFVSRPPQRRRTMA